LNYKIHKQHYYKSTLPILHPQISNQSKQSKTDKRKQQSKTNQIQQTNSNK